MHILCVRFVTSPWRAIQRVENFSPGHEHGNRTNAEQQPSADAGETIKIMHPAFDRAIGETEYDEICLELVLDDE